MGGATSKLAPVVRAYRILYSGTTTANGCDSRSPLGDRAREHRELHRRDTPRRRSKRAASTMHPRQRQDGNRKPGPVHAWGCGAHCRFSKAPPSSSDRPPQGGRERVGRGSLHQGRHAVRAGGEIQFLSRGETANSGYWLSSCNDGFKFGAGVNTVGPVGW